MPGIMPLGILFIIFIMPFIWRLGKLVRESAVTVD